MSKTTTKQTKLKKRAKVYNDRLLKLADFLSRKVKDENFDLDTVGSFCDTKEVKEGGFITEVKCLSTACAMGWMPSVFPQDIEGVVHYEDLNIRFVKSAKNKNRGYNDERDFDLAQKYFNLTSYESCWLFDPHYYDDRSRKSVASRIRSFAKYGLVPEKTEDYIRLCDDYSTSLEKDGFEIYDWENLQ